MAGCRPAALVRRRPCPSVPLAAERRRCVDGGEKKYELATQGQGKPVRFVEAAVSCSSSRLFEPGVFGWPDTPAGCSRGHQVAPPGPSERPDTLSLAPRAAGGHRRLKGGWAGDALTPSPTASMWIRRRPWHGTMHSSATATGVPHILHQRPGDSDGTPGVPRYEALGRQEPGRMPEGYPDPTYSGGLDDTTSRGLA